MSGPFGSSQWMYSSGPAAFYDFPIEQSLKFNDDDSSYLSWTPASTGDRRTWTWSGWVKRGTLGTTQFLLAAGTGGTDDTQMGLNFQADDTLRFTGQATQFRVTSQVFRDTSAWYHIVLQFDTLQAVANDRLKIYVNGEQITNFSTNNALVLNGYYAFNQAAAHNIGRWTGSGFHYDGYLAEVNFIDGQALDASSFGEFKSGVWIPKDPSGLTYGTNGFRLSFQNDTVSEGFNTVTWTGNSSTQSLNGVGFSPDFVWIKSRTNASQHVLTDTIRGATKTLISNATDAEATFTGDLTSFNADGFSVGSNSRVNGSGDNIVAWCWDAGSGSPVSNTDGSITSTVKANAAYGMSIISYTGTGSADTVGHGLSSAPEMILIKNRSTAAAWDVYHTSTTASQYLTLNATSAAASSAWMQNTEPTSSVFYLGGGGYGANLSGDNIIAYAFHSVTGYSKVGSWTGTGSGLSVTTGFKPAFVLLKNASDGTTSWIIFDGTRNTSDPRDLRLDPNSSDAESTFSNAMDFDANGFTINSSGLSQSGDTYIYIAFADTRDNAFWRDQSGNGNDWQPNNLTYQDSLPDSTTNNFAVLNPLANAGSTFSEGNLQISFGNDGSYNPPVETGTISIPSSGKYYFEAVLTAANAMGVGIQANTDVKVRRGSVDYGVYYVDSGNIYTYVNGSGTIVDSTPATFTTGDVIGVAYDADTNSISWYKNGTLQTSYTPSTGHEFTPAYYAYGSTVRANFGQDSSFAGSKPAQGNTDDNGIGDFYYAPPSALALCTANLPDPVIDPAKDDTPSDYFNTVTYNNTGTSYPKSVTGIGFQPDLIWVKSRTQAYDHYLFDAVRGTGAKKLSSNTTAAEGSDSTSISSFDSDGYTISSGAGIGDITGVTWSWLAGNGTSSNTAGSITTTVSTNAKAGFSIIGYTGTGANASIGHNLGQKPKIAFFKNRSSAVDWRVYYDIRGFGAGVRYLTLNSSAASVYDTNIWQNGPASNTVINIGTYSAVNASGNNYICYAFSEVENFSRFGRYVGNGSTDGPMLYLGFEPAFFLAKNVDSVENWFVIDNARHPYNDGNIPRLLPNLSNAEAEDASIAGDFLSNGFKIRATQNMINTSGANYIYMAFAYNPFKFANAR